MTSHGRRCAGGGGTTRCLRRRVGGPRSADPGGVRRAGRRPRVHAALRAVAAELLGRCRPRPGDGGAGAGAGPDLLRPGCRAAAQPRPLRRVGPGRRRPAAGHRPDVDERGGSGAVAARQVPGLAARLDGPVQILDVGTGVGWLAVALARAYPQARVLGIDIFPPALDLAAANVAAPRWRTGSSSARSTMPRARRRRRCSGSPGSRCRSSRRPSCPTRSPPYTARSYRRLAAGRHLRRRRARPAGRAVDGSADGPLRRKAVDGRRADAAADRRGVRRRHRGPAYLGGPGAPRRRPPRLASGDDPLNPRRACATSILDTPSAISRRAAGPASRPAVSEPCIPTRVRTRVASCRVITAQSVRIATRTCPYRSRSCRDRRARTSRRRSPRPGSGPRRARPAGPATAGHPGRAVAVDVELPEPRLAGQRRDAGHQHRVVLGDDLVVARDVEHAVVAGDDQPHIVGQRVAQPLGTARRWRPAAAATAADPQPVRVSDVVELPLVRVDEAALGLRCRGHGQRGPGRRRGLSSAYAHELRAAQRGLVSPVARRTAPGRPSSPLPRPRPPARRSVGLAW